MATEADKKIKTTKNYVVRAMSKGNGVSGKASNGQGDGAADRHVDLILAKARVLELLDEARTLKGLYDAENRRHPETRYNYGGSVDAIAWRLLEKQDRVVFVGVRPYGRDVHARAVCGYFGNAGNYLDLDPERGTRTYVLKDFSGTTVSRFAASLCKVLEERVGNEALRGHLEATRTRAEASRTRMEVEPYLR